MLVADADRRIELFGQLHRSLNAARRQNDARAVQDHREFGVAEHLSRLVERFVAARGTLKLHDGGQFNIDDLCPEIARHVDLRRGRSAFRLHDDAVQRLGDAGRIAHFFLIGDHVLEEGHLLNFLETALTDGFVRGLRRDQQQRRVVPVSGFDRRHEVGDAGAVLGDHHRHLAGGACVSVGHHASVTLMRRVPEGDPGLWEEIGDRHHGRADDPEGVLNAMHLQRFYESFFGRHFHRGVPPFTGVRSMPMMATMSLEPDLFNWIVTDASFMVFERYSTIIGTSKNRYLQK